MSGRVSSPAFIGRAEELRGLEAVWARAASGQPSIVLVGGEAGVGKTRLLAETAGRCTQAGARALRGGCVPVGDGDLPYAPVVEVVRRLVDDLGAATVRTLIGPSWGELARLVPRLGEPAGGPPGQAEQTRLFELVLGLLERLSEQAPLLLGIEDLHWSDRSTRDLLAFLCRNLHDVPILLVVTYRNDEPSSVQLGPYLAELDRGGPVQRLELPRLDRSETLAQLTSILRAAPAAGLVEAIFARSEGNPFYAEELLQAVEAGSLELPATLHDLLRGRVEALPQAARHILAVVAVAGRPVPHRLLAAVAAVEDALLDQGIRAAIGHQLLVGSAREDTYDVRHALLREVVEAELPPGQRIRLHLAFAHALTGLPELGKASPAAAAAELAVHWDAAGEPAQALPARVAAGLAAEAARAFPEAVGHYDRALELWELVPEPGEPAGLDRVDLLAHAAEAAASAGATERTVRLLEEAVDQVDATVQPVRAAGLLARLGFHSWRAGRRPAAFAAFDEATRLVATAPASAERARVYGARAHALWVSGRPRAALPYCEEAIAVARTAGARAEEAHALRVLGGCVGDMGQLERAIDLNLEARRLAEQIGSADIVVASYVSLVEALGTAGRDREALAAGTEGYRRSRELGLARAGGTFVAGNLAATLLTLGLWDECDRLTAELLAGDCWSPAALHELRGLLLARRGEFAAARAEIEQALRQSPAAFAEDGLQPLAELAIWDGHHDEAGAAIAEGLRLSVEDPDEDLPHRSSPWYHLALRLEADRAERAIARRAPAEVADARRRAAAVMIGVDWLAASKQPMARYPDVVCNLLLARAELSRVQGRTDPERWQAAVAALERLERPFETAYARFRQAEALLASRAPRAHAQRVLQMAYQTTQTLRAAPLQREVELLARRARLQVKATTPEAPRPDVSPAATLGLTRREAEVLALVAEGRTNRQIGQELFITPKTAGIHVSRILAKLGVAGRGEAAAVAHRLGLGKP